MATKWEYRVVRLIQIDNTFEKVLNPNGEEGWELVTVAIELMSRHACFKRKIEGGD